jgi:hypothetical protein
MLCYIVKVGACITAATIAAILIEAIANLRLESDADAILLVLWASTITIVAFSDRAFVSAFRTT